MLVTVVAINEILDNEICSWSFTSNMRLQGWLGLPFPVGELFLPHPCPLP